MRRLLSIVLSAMLLAALAGPVAANPTGRGALDIPLGAYDFIIPTDIGCADFDVLVEDIAGSIKEIYLGADGKGNVRTKTMFHTITRYTRTDTGASFSRPFDSIGHYLYRPNDGPIEISFLSGALLWGPEPAGIGLAPGIWLLEKAKGSVAYSADFSTLLSIAFQRGSTFDVCAALDG